MTKKEKIIEGLEELDEAGLAKVQAVVQDLTKPKRTKSSECIMEKLRRVKIDAAMKRGQVHFRTDSAARTKR